MSTFKGYDLGAFTAVSTGSAVDVSDSEEYAVAVSGTFVATIQVEVSHDGTNWAKFGADVTAPGTVKVDIPVKMIRAKCSAFTSGTAQVNLGARDTDRTP